MLRVGTVGTSSIMRTIQEAIRLTDGMECRVVYSRTEEQGRAFAAEMGVPEHCTDYAAMLERMYRGQDLPESPNELNDVPLLDILEEKLGRELDDKEADYVSKLEKRYRRFAIEQEIHDHDMVRLNPRWEIVSYDPLELWPVPPTNILEFWNYIAYAFNKKRLPYPEFMESITDLEKVQRKIHEWERSREDRKSVV